MLRASVIATQPALALIGGHDAGPLFAINKRRELVRPKGREGTVWRRQVKRRTPKFADRKAIADVYREAKRLTRETGILHVVDHIVPMCGGIVTGLHVHWNLRVIPWRENAQKGAFWWPDMPEQQEALF
ncbi:hypothetical protein [Paraburkholderia phosphatilytica]|uniref:hypothetical protein n=1 Tax=Paraburkholderia phosphatilytica TaxID=2282883 RepID=UPI000E469457|nr:hypothetical protein [Paraburkholderia phosphatilytica]